MKQNKDQKCKCGKPMPIIPNYCKDCGEFIQGNKKIVVVGLVGTKQNKELDWELNKEQKDWLLDVLNTKSDNALKVILINGLISNLLTQQRTELLEEIMKIIEVNVHVGSGYTDECDKNQLIEEIKKL